MTDQDEELDTLVRAVGKQIDNLYMVMKQTKDIYAHEYQLNKLPTDYVLDKYIESMGFGQIYGMVEKNLIDYYMATNDSWLSKKDVARYFKAAFINNVQHVIQTKGTRESIKALENVFA